MKRFIVLTLVSAALAAPLADQLVSVTQSTLGDYKLDIHTADLTRTEERLVNGDVVGTYSYPDADGIVHTVEYTAGKGGFVANKISPILHPIEETPEILAERSNHLVLLGNPGLEVVHSDPAVHSVPVVVVPSEHLVLPVAESNAVHIPESLDVLLAKEAHFAAHKEARARLGLP